MAELGMHENAHSLQCLQLRLSLISIRKTRINLNFPNENKMSGDRP